MKLSFCWLLILLGLPTFRMVAFDADHSRYGRVLAAHVVNGSVDYAALKAAPVELTTYLTELGAVGEPEFNGWDRPAQMAFLINLYNAATLKLIVDHYPVGSIRRIGGWFGSPWDIQCVRLFGHDVSLNHLVATRAADGAAGGTSSWLRRHGAQFWRPVYTIWRRCSELRMLSSNVRRRRRG